MLEHAARQHDKRHPAEDAQHAQGKRLGTEDVPERPPGPAGIPLPFRRSGKASGKGIGPAGKQIAEPGEEPYDGRVLTDNIEKVESDDGFVRNERVVQGRVPVGQKQQQQVLQPFRPGPDPPLPVPFLPRKIKAVQQGRQDEYAQEGLVDGDAGSQNQQQILHPSVSFCIL